MDASRYAADAIIRDGRCVHLRAIRPDDRRALLDGFHQLTGQSVYFRFLGARQELTEAELRYFTELDFERHVAIVASIEESGEEKPIGVGRYIRTTADPDGDVAELAITIADDYQLHGVGTVLFEQLVCIARRKGIARLTAEVLPCNRVMLDIFRHSGLDPDVQSVNGITRVEMDIAGREPVMHYDVQTRSG